MQMRGGVGVSNVDGWDYVTWEYQKCIMCPVCEYQPGRCDTLREMKLINSGGDSENWSSCFKCQGCELEVIVHHTMRIKSVEVTA